jgi:hypothetical protein
MGTTGSVIPLEESTGKKVDDALQQKDSLAGWVSQIPCPFNTYLFFLNSSTLTAVGDGREWSASHSSVLPPGKDPPIPIV